MATSRYTLPVSQKITVATDAGTVFVSRADDPTVNSIATFNEPVSFGPYAVARNFLVTPDRHATVTVTFTETDGFLVAETRRDVVELSGGSAPVDAVQASVTINPTGDENSLTYTAAEYGASGNDISISYVDPGANDAALAVTVFEKHISVSLATGAGGAITSTAAEVKAAIEAETGLVTIAIDAADSGGADDGSGAVTAIDRTYLESGAGTGVNVAGPGSRYVDTSDGGLFINTGTKAAPAWVELAEVA